MTSNLGSEQIQETYTNESDMEKAAVLAKDAVLDILRKNVRPEFINRIDDIVLFSPLTKEDIVSIVRLQIDLLNKRLADQHIVLEITDEALQLLAHKGFDPQYGARPVNRVVQNLVLNTLAKRLLSGKINKEKAIVLDAFDQELVFRNA